MRKKQRFTIGPELRVEMNREIQPEIPYYQFLSDYTFGAKSANIGELKEKDIIRIAAKRADELRKRGYPESWIKRDLEKLVESF